MYSRKFYLERVRLAKKLAALPENAARRRAYLTLAENWQKLAEKAALETPTSQGVTRKSSKDWEPMLHRAMREAGLT